MDVERGNAEAGCWLEPSAVARRLGMTKEGVLWDYYPHRGQQHDVEIWSVLVPEWRAGKQKS
jgi:ribosomal-protein-serine acetyltransferase